ncbi:hypothetical protein N7474_005918 [Penicillium riverlandense]|uniref:uncharacterized protein n=1 Tax=Penicillium riverlandense TaxID=1903569 RepID=UPI00254797DA|nr:uncharacterized protein N7474_005918 [Penicillium riverlandense]KAJ5820327.1 hypothetical protein N7474_005918 [Penicillium riverlandense]
MLPRRFSRRLAAVATAAVLFLLYHLYTLQSGLQPPPARQLSSTTEPEYTGEPEPVCPPLPGIEDVLVVMKTGVTESRDKVPIHFATTLRCISDYIIVSDFDEEIEGVKIRDVLRNVDPEVRDRIHDFDIYNRIRQQGRKGLGDSDFSDVANSAIGKPNNPGWKLDKWKFLPMAQEALRTKPNAKWFIFLEADTYVSWTTALAWLSHYDASEPHYLGTETQIADVIFAHGGSGFVLSNPALTRAVESYTSNTKEWHDYTDFHWAGDCILGKVLFDAGINLEFSWPILQNSHPGELSEFTKGFYREPWCFPSMALHHLTPADIKSLWEFESKRWRKNKYTLLHSDLFREYLYPEIATQPTRLDWDNNAEDDQPFATSFEDCREVCEAQKGCVQFVFKGGSCYTGGNPRLGNKASDAVSGWLTTRIRKMMDNKGLCSAPDWGV